jgi:hypothetical protein
MYYVCCERLETSLENFSQDVASVSEIRNEFVKDGKLGCCHYCNLLLVLRREKYLFWKIYLFI